MKSIAALLRESPFFEAFSPADIEALAAHAVMRSVPSGDVILRENEPAEALYMIVTGKVSLSFEISGASAENETTGAAPTLLRTLTEPGRVVGWSALVEPYHYRDTATAIEDTHLLVFERQWLERRAEENPRFGVDLMTQILWVLGNRLRETRIRLVTSRYEEEALAVQRFSNIALRSSASHRRCTSCRSIWRVGSPFPMRFRRLRSCETWGSFRSESCADVSRNSGKCSQGAGPLSSTPANLRNGERGSGGRHTGAGSQTMLRGILQVISARQSRHPRRGKSTQRARAHFHHEPYCESPGEHAAERFSAYARHSFRRVHVAEPKIRRTARPGRAEITSP